MAKAQGEKSKAAKAAASEQESAAIHAGAPAPLTGAERRLVWLNRGLLLGAIFSALLVYGQCLSAGWFYDDNDYVLLDPRINHLKLFMPGYWSQPPPELDATGGQNLILPGYDKPVIADRYLWHLSFALERVMFGVDAGIAHAVNILIHLSCVAMLFLALSRLTKLYCEDAERRRPGSVSPYWRLFSGIAALIFAVHPWAAEPVCYVSARNGSMGAFFCLLGLWLFAGGLELSRTLWARASLFGGALFCVVLAYGSKENFIAAPAGYLLAVWPLIFNRYWSISRGRTLAILGGGLAALLLIGWIGIESSERARGLFAQMSGAGWRYCFEIQSPTLLRTFADFLPCRRLSIETGYPDWPVWACWLSVLINIALILAGTLGGRITPVLLGVGWYYIFLLPSNSFLPRPDYLAGRNVYLPTVAVAVLAAGGVVWGLSRFRAVATPGGALAAHGAVQPAPHSRGALAVLLFAAMLWVYWAISANAWGHGYSEAELIWSRSAEVAPDHAVVRLNLAIELMRQTPLDKMQAKDRKQLESELHAAIDAEDSQTMRYHTPRPKQIVRALAWRYLGDLKRSQELYDEAEKCYRNSWAQGHPLTTWLNWLQTALDGKMTSTVTEILDEGFREWPNEWWPKVARDTTQALIWHKAEMTQQMQEDFEAAERAEDANEPGLRNLQIQVIMVLARQSIANKPLTRARIGRMRELGLTEEGVADLEKQLGDEP